MERGDNKVINRMKARMLIIKEKQRMRKIENENIADVKLNMYVIIIMTWQRISN